MGQKQQQFLTIFQSEFEKYFGTKNVWTGGQKKANTARLEGNSNFRRSGIKIRDGERFEIGDLKTDFQNHTVIIEFESGQTSILNLIKYWPYILKELDVKPDLPILLCHFSSWRSYGSYRDYWNWIMNKIETTGGGVFKAEQFDHGDSDPLRRNEEVRRALKWLSDCVK